MGLMDKVKAQAEQAMTKAQQGINQGQAKLDNYQSGRQTDAVMRDLGAAYYALARQGGSQQAVDAALAAVDAAEAAAPPAAPPGAAAPDVAAPGAPAPAVTPPPGAVPGDDFTL
jgi:hypothetical protein